MLSYNEPYNTMWRDYENGLWSKSNTNCMLWKPFIKISKRYQPAVARDYVKKLRFIEIQGQWSLG